MSTLQRRDSLSDQSLSEGDRNDDFRTTPLQDDQNSQDSRVATNALHNVMNDNVTHPQTHQNKLLHNEQQPQGVDLQQRLPEIADNKSEGEIEQHYRTGPIFNRRSPPVLTRNPLHNPFIEYIQHHYQNSLRTNIPIWTLPPRS